MSSGESRFFVKKRQFYALDRKRRKKRDFPLENCRFLARFLDVQIRRILSRDLANFRNLRTVCAHFAHSLRAVSGPEFPFLGVRTRGRGKNPRPPRNEFGSKSTLPANFFGARYQQKAVGSNANLRPSGAREIIMVTKERPGGGRRREKRRTGEGPCNSIAKISS